MEKLGIEFKLIIAYLIPGILFLYATTFYSSATKKLLFGGNGIPESAAVIPIMLLAIGAGMMVNAVTWAVVRPVIEFTSMARPELDYASLTASDMQAFQVINDENYRYYQSYSNLFTSGIMLIASYTLSSESFNYTLVLVGLVFLVILFIASRDSLKRAYNGMESLVGVKKESNMTNGVPAPVPSELENIEKKKDRTSVNDNKGPSNDSGNKKPAKEGQQQT